MSLENFHQIGMATLDPMRVWKFARAGERLQEYCSVFAFSVINEYDAWSETESYYFGDDGRPTGVTFDPSYGRAYRQEVARDTDIHGAISPRGGWTEVVRLHRSTPHIPIYGLLNDPGDEALMLVEGAPTSTVDQSCRLHYRHAQDPIPARRLRGVLALADDALTCSSSHSGHPTANR